MKCKMFKFGLHSGDCRDEEQAVNDFLAGGNKQLVNVTQSSMGWNTEHGGQGFTILTIFYEELALEH